MLSLKKVMYSLVSNIHYPELACASFFKRYSVSGKMFLKVFICYALCVKKNGNFLRFNLLCFFYSVASISSVQATVVQFSNSCCSRLLIQIVFDNLSRSLIIFLQHFDVLMILNRPLTAVLPGH